MCNIYTALTSCAKRDTFPLYFCAKGGGGLGGGERRCLASVPVAAV